MLRNTKFAWLLIIFLDFINLHLQNLKVKWIFFLKRLYRDKLYAGPWFREVWWIQRRIFFKILLDISCHMIFGQPIFVTINFRYFETSWYHVLRWRTEDRLDSDFV